MPHNKKPHPAKNRRAAGEKESNESDSNFPYLKQAILGHIYTSRRPETAKRRNESIMNHKYRQKRHKTVRKHQFMPDFFRHSPRGDLKNPVGAIKFNNNGGARELPRCASFVTPQTYPKKCARVGGARASPWSKEVNAPKDPILSQFLCTIFHKSRVALIYIECGKTFAIAADTRAR